MNQEFKMSSHFGVTKIFTIDGRLVASFAYEEGEVMLGMIRESLARNGDSLWDEQTAQYVVGSMEQLDPVTAHR